MNALTERRDNLLELAMHWADYEDEYSTTILGFSLHYLLLYTAWDDIIE